MRITRSTVGRWSDADHDAEEDDAADATRGDGDMDGEGYGGTWITATACSQPTGYTANSDDCDDLESLSFPGAPELCDGKDNDCDGIVDNGCNSDVDGDGYISEDCGGNDCDDTLANSNPDGIEVCDLNDNDCNGEIDDGIIRKCDTQCGEGAETWDHWEVRVHKRLLELVTSAAKDEKALRRVLRIDYPDSVTIELSLRHLG